MKKYSSYQKTQDVYFSLELAFLMVPVAIATCISYGLLYFYGISTTVYFNVFISFCAYFYFYYGLNQGSKTFSAFLIGVALISGLLLFIDYSLYLLVIYQKTGIFHWLYFQLWLLLLVGTPTAYYAYKYGNHYLKERAMAVNYVNTHLNVHHDRELLLYVDTIQFVNTSKRRMSDIKLGKPACFHSDEEIKKIETDTSRKYDLERSFFRSLIHIPIKTDVLMLSWYSILEDKYYDIKFPFPFEKMILEQEKYPTNVSAVLRGKKTKSLQLNLLTNGGFRLFNSDMVLINHLNSIPTSITEEVRKEKIKNHQSSHEYYKNPENFSSLVAKIKATGGIEERFMIQNKLVPWKMTLSGLEGENYLDVFDVSFKVCEKIEIETLGVSMLRFLPKKLEIVYRGDYLCRWLILRINAQKLYQYIKKLTDGNEETPILFDLIIKNSSKTTDLKFTLNANGRSIVFTDWEIEIDKNRKQEMEDHLLDKDEEEQKSTLLKEAWALVGNKKYDLAQEKCDAILALDPRYAYAYFLESRLLWYNEGTEACFAKKDYFLAKTKHEPSAMAHIYNNYGCLLDLEQRYEESKFYFEKAMESYPKEGIYVCNLAEIYCKLKEPKKAMEWAEKSRKLGYESETLNSILESKGTHDFIKKKAEQ